ncbi:MAG: spermidine/putrescine ABC transporter substrate-binding protein [Firmicutes bacterium]|nr:spermidine/putrescine ABC transporter substrate-binding protein [Bacillota bacterium]
MKKKIIAMLLCTAMVGTMLTGCGEKKEEDNRELVLYTWEGLFPQEVLDSFEEEKGIKIISSNFDSNETMLEKVQQSDGKDYDLVIGDDYIIEQVVNSGLAKELDKAKLTNYGNINPLYQSQFYDPDNKYTIPHGAGIPLIVYDPEQVDFEIKGYSDLWNPELEDKIATIASYRAIEGMVLLTMGKSMNEEDPAVIKEAGEKLKELAPNIRMIQDTNTQNALLNGEAAVGILYTSQVIAALAENPDLKVVYPEEGLGFGIMNFYIPKNAPDTEEAYEFLDYILEPEVAAECFNFLGYYCTNKAADELVNPDLVVPDSVTKGEIIQNVSQEAEEVYNQNWTEFKAACD